MDHKTKPQGYWTSMDDKQFRAFFEEFAKGKNLDPLSPDTWYNLSRGDFKEEKVRSFLIIEKSKSKSLKI